VNLGLHAEAAGSSFIARCELCKRLLRIYERSLYGIGKKCKCGFVHHPPGLEEKGTFTRLKLKY